MDIQKQRIQVIRKFLTINGFIEKAKNEFYSNEKCSIVIERDNCWFLDTELRHFQTDSLSVFELIGTLTYYGLIDRDYKTIENEKI